MNYMGIDHHNQYSHITVMDEAGEVIRSEKVAIALYHHILKEELLINGKKVNLNKLLTNS